MKRLHYEEMNLTNRITRITFLFLCLILMSALSKAQYSKYIIKLKDKKSNYTLANPSAYLSEKAIARRQRSGSSIDSTDLPIVPAYLQALKAVPNVTVLNNSKWLNQVLIRTTDPSALATIQAMPFVVGSAPVAAVAYPGIDPLQSQKFPKEENKVVDMSVGPLRTSVTGNAIDYGKGYAQIHFHEGEFLHNLGLTGTGITMAVLDAGFLNYKTNPGFDSVRLQQRILGEWDYVANEQSVTEDHFHGANCFSIIAGNYPGNFVGSAPHAKFYLFRTEDAATEYPIEEQNWIAAAEYADSAGVDMISSSLGYTDFSDPVFNHTYAQRDGNTTMITIAADMAAKKGILVCNSAGNSGTLTSDYKYVSCPADGDSVMAVGAANVLGQISVFSSYGPNSAGKVKPDITSVGWDTYFINTAGNVTYGSGTSYSNPLSAGLIACLWQGFPELSNMQIMEAVKKSAHRYNNPDGRFGYGFPNYRNTLYALSAQTVTSTATAKQCYYTIQWTIRDDSSFQYIVERQLPNSSVYSPVSTFKSAATKFGTHTQSYTDTLVFPGTGIVKYRVKMITSNNSTFELFTKTNEITIPCIEENKIIISPNPFKEQLYTILNLTGSTNQLHVVVTDIQGRTVYKKTGKKETDFYALPIQTAHWEKGIYIVSIYDGVKKIEQRKVVKL